MRHDGERAVQLRAGARLAEWGSAKVGAAIPARAKEFLEHQRMLLIGAADASGAVWCSLLTGPPGFADVADDRTVVVDALPGPADPLAGRFGEEHDVGVLAIEPSTRRRMRVNGRGLAAGGRLVVHTDQVYSNCPKYIQVRAVLPDDRPGPAGRESRAQVTDALTAGQRRRIAAADTFFVATRAEGLGSDASHRGGNPGFVTVSGDHRLSWPDYAGNAMYMTLGNLALDPRCGLLFVDWDSGTTLQLTGRAGTDWDPDRAAAVPGAQRMVDFTVDRVVEITGASPLRWEFGGYSKFNPA